MIAATTPAVGTKIGRWTTRSAPYVPPGQKQTFVDCACSCGNTRSVKRSVLVRGESTSCGCLRAEITTARNLAKPRRPHINETPLYQAWAGMKHRCKSPRYARYKGRGIAVCDDWRNDFGAFERWAKSAGYAPGLQIDRINNDGNYEPSNCRWVTAVVNCNNRSVTLYLTAWGEKKALMEWLRDPRCRSTKHALLNRYRKGWDHERAITTPSQRR